MGMGSVFQCKSTKFAQPGAGEVNPAVVSPHAQPQQRPQTSPKRGFGDFLAYLPLLSRAVLLEVSLCYDGGVKLQGEEFGRV